MRSEDLEAFTVRKYKAYKGRNPKNWGTCRCKTEEIAVFQGGKGIKEDGGWEIKSYKQCEYCSGFSSSVNQSQWRC